MSAAWPRAPLGELADINPAMRVAAKPDDEVAFVPMAAVDADRSTVQPVQQRPFASVSNGLTYFEDGDVLVAKITPCWENGKVAQARITHSHGFASTEFHVVRPKNGAIDARFVLHYLRQERVRRAGQRRMTGSAGQRRVPVHFLQELITPVPDIGEQRRIAAILDQADELRAKRRRAIGRLDALGQALFADIFQGDASRLWPRHTIASLATRIRTGPFGSQLLHSEFVDSGIAVLGIDNVVQNEFSWAKPRFITESKFRGLKRYAVTPGDVLITIMGTCGRCAVVPDGIPLAINTKHLCCITLDTKVCAPRYLQSSFLLHPDVRLQLGLRERGAMLPGLNMQLIKELVVPLPPRCIQEAFVEKLRALDRLRTALRESLAKLDVLFASLQHRAFRGEL